MRPTVPEALRRAWFAGAAVAAAFAFGGGSPLAADPEPAPAPLSASQLDELVAPVALYPDVVLDSLLPACTVPEDVTAASAYLTAQGGAASAAPEGATWEPSVVAMLQFPDVLQWMGENPAWVERLGFAVTMQQGEVLAAIQRYRSTAQAAGVLASNAYTNVTPGPGTTIVISPASPSVVYVPVYDPWLLRGPYAYSPAVPFFSAWFSFSFGNVGFWSRHRIFWGSGIYGYGDAWWYGSWRSGAADWGTSRPTRWASPYRSSQPWARSGWTASGASRPGSYRTARSRSVYVSPPRGRTSTRTPRDAGAQTPGTPRWTQPVAPAAPITRWGRSGRTSRSPGYVAPRAAPRVVAPDPVPRVVSPPSVVPGRGTVNGWRRRGSDSLGGGTRAVPRTAPVAPAPRIAPAPRPAPAPRVAPAPRPAPAPRAVPVPRTDVPRVRSFPPTRSAPADVDGRRTRADGQRGRRSLGS